MGSNKVLARADMPVWLRVLRVVLTLAVAPVAIPLRVAMVIWEGALTGFVILGQALIAAWRGGDF